MKMHIAEKDDKHYFNTGYGEHIYHLASPEFGDLKHHSIVYVEVEPGKSSKKHYHPLVEETYYILSGDAEMILDDEVATLKPGQLVYVPPKAEHKITNLSLDNKLSFLAICATPWTPDCSVFTEA
jgi:mannose-6-phosphate isomerase-like protein (cupin superfamily)